MKALNLSGRGLGPDQVVWYEGVGVVCSCQALSTSSCVLIDLILFIAISCHQGFGLGQMAWEWSVHLGVVGTWLACKSSP